jgi:hypothetical protein
VFALNRCLLTHRLKETIISVIVQMGAKKSSLIPILDRGGDGTQLFGKLRDGKHTPISKPLITWNQAAGLLDVPNAQPTKRRPINGTHSLMGQFAAIWPWV